MRYDTTEMKDVATKRTSEEWKRYIRLRGSFRYSAEDGPEKVFRVLHITHTDADGLACSVIAEHLLMNVHNVLTSYTPLFIEPTQLLDTIKKLKNDLDVDGAALPDIVLITDLNFNQVHMDEMDFVHVPYLVLDHHISDLTEEDYQNHPWILCEYQIPDQDDYDDLLEEDPDPKHHTAIADVRSGASLVADVLMSSSSKISYLSRSIAARDTFSHKKVPLSIREEVNKEDAEKFNSANFGKLLSHEKFDRYRVGNRLNEILSLLGRDFFLQYLRDYLENDMGVGELTEKVEGEENEYFFLPKLIDANQEKVSKKIDQLIDSAMIRVGYLPVMQENQREKWVPYRIGAMIADGIYASDAGNRLCEERNVDVALIWTNMKEYSLRSTKPNVDVQAIAKCYGGGGHKHAAGFPCNDVSSNEMYSYFKYDAPEPEEEELTKYPKEPNIFQWKTEIRDIESDEILPVNYSVALTEGFSFDTTEQVCGEVKDVDVIADIVLPSVAELYLIKENPTEEEIRYFYRICGIGSAKQDSLLENLASDLRLCPVAAFQISNTDGAWLVRARFNGIVNLTGRTMVDIPIIPMEKKEEGTKLEDIPSFGFDRYKAHYLDELEDGYESEEAEETEEED